MASIIIDLLGTSHEEFGVMGQLVLEADQLAVRILALPVFHRV